MWKIGCRFWCSIGVSCYKSWLSLETLTREKRESCRATKIFPFPEKMSQERRLEKSYQTLPLILSFFEFQNGIFSVKFSHTFWKHSGLSSPRRFFSSSNKQDMGKMVIRRFMKLWRIIDWFLLRFERDNYSRTSVLSVVYRRNSDSSKTVDTHRKMSVFTSPELVFRLFLFLFSFHLKAEKFCVFFRV